MKTLAAEHAPRLVALCGVGTDVAAALLVAAGDNPERLRSEATFAHLCGVVPFDASSGRHEHHRLNRGGDRHANSPYGTSSSPAWSATNKPATTSTVK
jgi:transposase